MSSRDVIELQKIKECPICTSIDYIIENTANGYTYECTRCEYKHHYQFDIFGMPLPEMHEGEM